MGFSNTKYKDLYSSVRWLPTIQPVSYSKWHSWCCKQDRSVQDSIKDPTSVCLSLAPTWGMFENAAMEDGLPDLQNSTNLKSSNWACITQLAICHLHTASEMLLSYFIRGTMVVKCSRGPMCSLLQFCWAAGRPIPRNLLSMWTEQVVAEWKEEPFRELR